MPYRRLPKIGKVRHRSLVHAHDGYTRHQTRPFVAVAEQDDAADFRHVEPAREPRDGAEGENDGTFRTSKNVD